MDDEIVILTTTDRIGLTPEEATHLLEHIWRDGGDNHARATTALAAATTFPDGTAEVRWTDEAKTIALTAITTWLDSEGAWDVPGSVMDLRYGLMRDLKQPPYDHD